MEKNGNSIHDMRFLSLVMSLHSSAWIALGKVANPMTGKMERDLAAAQAHINLLETLKVKTKGNLSHEEEKILSNYLSMLQLNYVEESSRTSEKPPEEAVPDSGDPKEGPEKKA
ncbi:MAG: DUF1844 domain-containing protein [Candidatus Aureabacteria bacterium]|nr:DUF1844 domain-containing protein [Candidatus Auribacterota bacterium]